MEKVSGVSDLDENKLDDYIHLIDKKLLASAGDWSCLSHAERTVITAYRFALEVSNGGIEQFFTNPSGDAWRETLQSIRAVRAARLANIVERALTVFPNHTPAEDQLTRCDQLRMAGGPARQLLGSLTGEYYDLQSRSAEHCLYQRLTAVAIRELAAGGAT
jgi:hypothetical protein